jgi:hypothetical protein
MIDAMQEVVAVLNEGRLFRRHGGYKRRLIFVVKIIENRRIK